MGLVIRREVDEEVGELYCPVIECDVCGKKIREDGRFETSGAYLWLEERHDPSGRIAFVHKGACHRRWDAEHGDPSTWLWMDLVGLPHKLLFNLGYEQESRALWRRLGEPL